MVYFTYNVSPPTSIANMFGNWLNGVEKKKIKLGYLLVILLYIGQYGPTEIVLYLVKKRVQMFCTLFDSLRVGYSHGPYFS
jgi:hypothetical protein